MKKLTRVFASILGVALLVLTTLAYSPQKASAMGACTIAYFNSSNNSNLVTQWTSTQLSWDAENCTTVTLSSSNGIFNNTTVTNTSSISTGPIGSPTSFTLFGTDAYGYTSQAHLTINTTNANINNDPGTGGSPCTIYEFSSSYTQVYVGQNASITWNASPSCMTVSISGYGNYYTNLSDQGTMSVGPLYNSANYTLTVADIQGVTQTKQLSITASGNEDQNSQNYWNNYNNNYPQNYNSGNGNCVITSFYPSSTSISSGNTVALTWSTSGCYDVTMSGSNGSLQNTYTLPTSGSVQTNPMYGTGNFVLTANGNTNSATYPAVVVYVTGGPYAYNTSSNNSDSSAISGIATNIGAYSAKLNGVLVGNPGAPTDAWFEYSTDMSFGSNTGVQHFNTGSTKSFNDTIVTNPSTTYYYRAVVRSNGGISKGDTMTLVTKDHDDSTIFAQNTTNDDTTATSTTIDTGTSTSPTLAITDAADKVYIGDIVDFKVVYTNNTDQTISNTKLNIVLPQGFNLIQTTKGQTVSPTIVNADLGTLGAGETGSIFIQAKVENTVSLTNTLVTNGTMSFTYPNGSNDSTVGYVLNHAGGVAALGGFSFGAGFFPTTILGWIITILIILAVILTIRRISKMSHGDGGHGAAHH